MGHCLVGQGLDSTDVDSYFADFVTESPMVRLMFFVFLVCRGSSSGLAHGPEVKERYQTYKNIYSNCTYVDGNLELVFFDGQESYDLSFLQDIREITGYVLIVANYADYIPLTSLRIIRGRHLYEHEGKYYSLYVALNYDRNKQNVGLKELRLTSLRGMSSFVPSGLRCFFYSCG